MFLNSVQLGWIDNPYNLFATGHYLHYLCPGLKFCGYLFVLSAKYEYSALTKIPHDFTRVKPDMWIWNMLIGTCDFSHV